ncbi:hypothetical protein [Brevundimonas bacteroides]|uniref:hypothetical protein n=1 Tax=Brevundimonas bacteroides TaxID=74311 RepID=UPI000494E116|nr:hypothetical protein [Brevundimonas bacteroides]
MAGRLKVFAWSDGFHRFTVATTSRPKALEAWGVGQDLFAGGLADEIREGDDYDAALARPGTVIRTGVAVDPGEVKPVRPKANEPAAKRARARRDQLKAELETLETETERALSELAAEREALDARMAEVKAKADRERKRLKAALNKDDGG